MYLNGVDKKPFETPTLLSPIGQCCLFPAFSMDDTKVELMSNEAHSDHTYHAHAPSSSMPSATNRIPRVHDPYTSRPESFNTDFAPSSSSAPKRRRGRRFKEVQMVSSNYLPVSRREIVAMSLSDLRQMMHKEQLTDYQRSLIKTIRRREKNRLDARTCRQRRKGRAQQDVSEEASDGDETFQNTISNEDAKNGLDAGTHGQRHDEIAQQEESDGSTTLLCSNSKDDEHSAPEDNVVYFC